MAVTAQTRAAVRDAFGGRCGYCGVSEASAGVELEMDHFHPQAAGGSDDFGNLVYACTACNRFKGDYSPGPDTPESLRLLRPQIDDSSGHIVESAHGRLLGLSSRGWFHVQRLHLNRPQLVEVRNLRHVLQAHRDELARTREAEERLRREIDSLQGEIARLRSAMTDLLRRGEH